MLRTASTSSRPGTAAPAARSGRRRLLASIGAAAAVVLGTGLIAGCAEPAQAGPLIQLSTAQVLEPGPGGISNAYLDVTNNGPADKIVAARLSVGGRVSLRSPVRPDQVEMRTVTSINIPAKSLTRLAPNSSHLLISGAGPMRSGTEITLTLVFAHGGTFSVAAMVTNPQTGGSSYFLN
jgi:copper(I)-binding protein